MKVILCLDKKNGMMFNQRRQSRDAVVIQDIIDRLEGCELWMNSYSAKLFEGNSDVKTDEKFLQNCPDDAWCFVENEMLLPLEQQISEIIVYRWGRVYPADLQLDINLKKYALEMEETMVGSSHPEMKRQVYRRKK